MPLHHGALRVPVGGNGRAPSPSLLHPAGGVGMGRAWGRWTTRAHMMKAGTLTFG